MTYDFTGEDKPQTGICQTYHRNPNYDLNKPESETNREFFQCDKQGIRRVDHGLDSGIHCDEDWDELIFSCRQQSW